MEQNQKKAPFIGRMETRNGVGPEESVIHRAYGDAKRRRIRRKRHPSPVWRHEKAQNQKKASSIARMETRNGAESEESVIHRAYGDEKDEGSEESAIHRAYGDAKRRRIKRKRHPSAVWRHEKAQDRKKAPSIARLETRKAQIRKKRHHLPSL